MGQNRELKMFVFNQRNKIKNMYFKTIEGHLYIYAHRK